VHPIFSKRTFMAWFLLAVILGATGLALMLRLTAALSWQEAAGLGVPLALLYAFV
jgi:hypothetical protein